MKISSTFMTMEFALINNMSFAQKKYNYIPITSADSPSEIIRKAANVIPTPRQWETITSGTTIGYKRLLKFNAVTAKKVRLCITSSRLNPTIYELGLYKMRNI